MDIDWCLTCEKRVEGSSLYCSLDCQNRAGPSTIFSQSRYHFDSSLEEESADEDIISHAVDEAQAPLTSRWTGNDYEGIVAWAAEIPAGAPAGEISTPLEDSSSVYSSMSSTYRPPTLLKPNRQAVPPSLCVSTPKPVTPPLSAPVLAPKRHPSTTSAAISGGQASASKTSLKSAVTESSLATPASSHPVPISGSRKPSILGAMYSHVRSWVTPPPSMFLAKQGTPPPIYQVDSAKFTVLAPAGHLTPVKVASSQHLPRFSNDTTCRWMASTLVVEPKSQYHTQSTNSHAVVTSVRKYTQELPRPYDHPSFRERGRKASRAAA